MDHTTPNTFTLCLSMVIGIALGALGAHALSPFLDEHQQSIWEKAVFYQLINTVGLLAISGKITSLNRTMKIGKLLIFIGLILFSGTLYLLSTRHLIPWPVIPVIGILTPVGGVLMIAGWLMVGVGWRSRPTTA